MVTLAQVTQDSIDDASRLDGWAEQLFRIHRGTVTRGADSSGERLWTLASRTTGPGRLYSRLAGVTD